MFRSVRLLPLDMGRVGHRWTVAFRVMTDCIVAHIFSVEGGRKRPGRDARGTAAAELFPLPESAERGALSAQG